MQLEHVKDKLDNALERIENDEKSKDDEPTIQKNNEIKIEFGIYRIIQFFMFYITTKIDLESSQSTIYLEKCQFKYVKIAIKNKL